MAHQPNRSTEQADPASASDEVRRVRYVEGQLLRAEDLADEQAYRIAMRRRHNVAAHGWGVVTGLDIDPQRWLLEPGTALDGFGRELRDAVDWARGAVERLRSRAYGAGGGGEGPFYRLREWPMVRATLPMEPLDPRRPEGVGLGDQRFLPHRCPPDDPARVWPVFLGRVHLRPAGSALYVVEESHRPYAGLVGNQLTAPWGPPVLVQVGTDPDFGFLSDQPPPESVPGDPAQAVPRPDPDTRFAVYLPLLEEPQAAPPDRLIRAPARVDGEIKEVDLVPRLDIRRGGAITLRGTAELYGNLSLVGGAVELRASPQVPVGARPWRIYHVQRPAADVEEELRIEMGLRRSGEKARANQVVVGVWSEKENKFRNCLTITDDCKVTVHGDLHVEGKIEGDITASVRYVQPRLAPEAEPIVRSMFLSAVAGSVPSALAGVLQGPFEAVLRMLSQQDGRVFVVAVLKSKADILNGFVTVLVSTPECLEAIARNLPTDPAKLGPFGSGLDADPTRLEAVAALLMATPERRGAIAAKLPTTQPELQTFGAALDAVPARREALAELMMATPERRGAVAGHLPTAVADLATFGAALDAVPARREALAELMMATADRRAAIASKVPENPNELTSFGTALDNAPTRRDAVATLMMRTKPRRKVIAQKFPETLSQLDTFGEGIDEVANRRDAMAQLMVDTTARREVIARRLIDKAADLKQENPQLAQQLRAALA